MASLERAKAIPYLFDAVRSLVADHPDITLEIIGEGPDRGLLHELAEGLPVTFLGARSRADVAARMAEADVFALPSLVETFGIAAVEALSAGLPVVCTSGCGVASLVAAHGGLVVPPADVSALRDALATLLVRADGVPSNTVGELRRRYGPEAIADEWDNVYRSAIGRSRFSERDGLEHEVGL